MPDQVVEAITTTTAGATGVARLAIDGLLELGDDRTALSDVAAFLRARLPGYAPIWHIANAANAADPTTALRDMRRELDAAVTATVRAAADWLSTRPGPIETAPSSSIVKAVLDAVGVRDDHTGSAVGLAGADAISPTAFLNILGTRGVTDRYPTLVVSTSLKLVPEGVFATLGAPTFERIPLDEVTAVVIDGIVHEPREMRRLTALVHA